MVVWISLGLFIGIVTAIFTLDVVEGRRSVGG